MVPRVSVSRELLYKVLKDELLRVRKCGCGGEERRGNDGVTVGSETLVARETGMGSLGSLMTLRAVSLCSIVPV